MNNAHSLSKCDQRVLWHPFTQHGLESEILPVDSAWGAWIKLEDNRRILDAISSWWVNLHGHAHPAIAQAIYDQSHQLEHVIFAGFTHEPAVTLAEMILSALQLRGTALSRCFYSDNGSTAVEVAMKMAYQYHRNLGIKSRTRFISLTNSFHGDTLGGIALSAHQGQQEYLFASLPPVDFISCEDISALEKLLSDYPNQYAALFIEPMIQAVGGMLMHSADFLAKVAALCKDAGVLLICDEVFTGFYRTGTCFAFEHARIKPDLLCLSKGMTGGFLPLAATIATEEIYDSFHRKQSDQTFFHGHSFTANPLACAAAIASWRLLHHESTQHAIVRISNRTKAWMEHLAKHNNCEAARALGTIGALNMRHCRPGSEQEIHNFAIDCGVLLRPIGQVLYAVPPYCISDEEIDLIYSVIEAILEEFGVSA